MPNIASYKVKNHDIPGEGRHDLSTTKAMKFNCILS